MVLESQLPHKIVNFWFTITNVKNKLTDLRGKGLLQNGFMNTFCGISLWAGRNVPPSSREYPNVICAPVSGS